jgi:hypothetical protein
MEIAREKSTPFFVEASDPADDFDYPSLPENHPLRKHVLYRLDSVSYFDMY